VIINAISILVARPEKKIFKFEGLGSNLNAEEKCYGLAQSDAFDGFLYRTVRLHRVFDSGGFFVINV
jgi:hypothetical protein